MKKTVVAMVLCSILLGATPSRADNHSTPNPSESPTELLGDAANRLVRALELMLMAIPQYEAPEQLENGDIIIRRKNPNKRAPRETEPHATSEQKI